MDRKRDTKEDRIIVIGSSCSGKSSFAKALAVKKKIKHIELDQLHWLPNWLERSDNEFRELVQQAIDPAVLEGENAWIIDGNYSVTRDISWPKATQIIWLNHNFTLVLYRSITRSLYRIFTKKPLFAGNVESFRKTFFSRDSIIWWVIKTFHKKRSSYEAVLKEQTKCGMKVVELKGQRQVDAYLLGVSEVRKETRSKSQARSEKAHIKAAKAGI